MERIITKSFARLMGRGIHRGFITHEELNKSLGKRNLSSENLSQAFIHILDESIILVEKKSDYKVLRKKDTSSKEEGKSLEKSDDPIRMYLREMGGVELLSREGEIAIAKRIEAGKDVMLNALSQSPITAQQFFDWDAKLQNDEILVIEVNPRASRTVPFVSKANGIPLAKIASRIMSGEKLSKYKLKYKTNKKFAVKEAVFPFNKFPDSDLLLGPEMKSTGEVMGFDDDFGMAVAKSQIAASNSLPTKGMAFLSVKDSHKQEIIGIAQRLIKLGFKLSATKGTFEIIKQNGMKCKKINKVSSGRPHIVDVLNSKKISLVINTGGGNSEHRISDARALRRGTLANKIPYCTNMSTAYSFLEAIKSLKTTKLKVKSLQDI